MDVAKHTLRQSANKFSAQATATILAGMFNNYLLLFQNHRVFAVVPDNFNADSIDRYKKRRLFAVNAATFDTIFDQLKAPFLAEPDEDKRTEKVAALIYNCIWRGLSTALPLDAAVALTGLIRGIHEKVAEELKLQNNTLANGANSNNKQPDEALTFIDAMQDLMNFGVPKDESDAFNLISTRLTALSMDFATMLLDLGPWQEDGSLGNASFFRIYTSLDEENVKRKCSQQFRDLISIVTNTQAKGKGNQKKMDVDAQGFTFNWQDDDPNPLHGLHKQTSDENPLHQLIGMESEPSKKTLIGRAMKQLCEGGGIWTEAHLYPIADAIESIDEEYEEKELQHALFRAIKERKAERLFTTAHILMIDTVMEDPSMSKETMAKLLKIYKENASKEVQAGQLSFEHRRIYEYNKNHGRGGQQRLRFHQGAEDKAFRALLDRFINPKDTSRFVNLALRDNAKATLDVLGQPGLDHMKLLEVICTGKFG